MVILVVPVPIIMALADRFESVANGWTGNKKPPEGGLLWYQVRLAQLSFASIRGAVPDRGRRAFGLALRPSPRRVAGLLATVGELVGEGGSLAAPLGILRTVKGGFRPRFRLPLTPASKARRR